MTGQAVQLECRPDTGVAGKPRPLRPIVRPIAFSIGLDPEVTTPTSNSHGAWRKEGGASLRPDEENPRGDIC